METAEYIDTIPITAGPATARPAFVLGQDAQWDLYRFVNGGMGLGLPHEPKSPASPRARVGEVQTRERRSAVCMQGGPPMARDFATETANKALVQASFDRWSSHSGSPFELLAADAAWTIVGSSPLSKTYPSKQAFLDAVNEPFNAPMATPLRPTIPGPICGRRHGHHSVRRRGDRERRPAVPLPTPTPGTFTCRIKRWSTPRHSSIPATSTSSGPGFQRTDVVMAAS